MQKWIKGVSLQKQVEQVQLLVQVLLLCQVSLCQVRMCQVSMYKVRPCQVNIQRVRLLLQVYQLKLHKVRLQLKLHNHQGQNKLVKQHQVLLDQD